MQKEGGRGYRYAHGGSYIGTNPSFSPDGSKIVFGSVRDGVGDIYVINSDGANLRRLTNTSEYEGDPIFSPDGSKIVFVSERSTKNNGEIYIMNSDGSNQVRLTYNDNEVYDYNPSFSPDGMKIIFARQLKKYYYTDIFMMDVDRSNQKRLTFDNIPKGNSSFLKDGKTIRYSILNLKTKQSEIYEIKANNSKPILVSQLPQGAYDATYSKDEKEIVFVSSSMTNYKVDPYTKTEIFIMNSDKKNLTQLTNTETYKSFPTFSPDGKKIIFLSLEKDGRGKGQIMVMNVDGSDLKTITNNY